MDLFLYAVFGLAATWGLYALYMQIATRASEGRPAAPLIAAIPALQDQQGPALVYFTSPHCAPCRPMTKDVTALQSEGTAIYKLDVVDYPELAREMGVRATPTLMLIERGSVSRVFLGVKSREVMRELINDTD